MVSIRKTAARASRAADSGSASSPPGIGAVQPTVLFDPRALASPAGGRGGNGSNGEIGGSATRGGLDAESGLQTTVSGESPLAGDDSRSREDHTVEPPPPLVLGGHATSLTPY